MLIVYLPLYSHVLIVFINCVVYVVFASLLLFLLYIATTGEFIKMERILELNDNFIIQSSTESFSFSFFDDDYDYDHHHHHDHELFFDMNTTVPFASDHHHHNMIDHNSSLPETEGFEFSMTFSKDGSSENGITGALSPADDLFYKGQLLPLHLPPRLHMVEHLSSKNTSQDNGTTYEESMDPKAHQALDMWKSAIVTELSYKASHLERAELKRQNSTMVKSYGSWIDVKEIKGANVFPNCYKDPHLQIVEDEANHDAMSQSSNGYTRPSLRWKGFLQGSKRSCPSLEIMNDKNNYPRKAKEGHKWGFSILKLRAYASASFLKSFFTDGGELGRVHMHQKEHKYHAHDETSIEKTRESDNSWKKGDNPWKKGDNYANYPIRLTNYAEAEGDRIITKERDYPQKYAKLFKSIYLMRSHTANEQPRNLFENSSIDGSMLTVSSSSCDSKQEPMISHKSIIRNLMMETKRTNPISRRSKSMTSSPANKVMNIHHSGVLRSNESCNNNMHCGDSNLGFSYMEGETSIQGAIAHCKQSFAKAS